MRDASCIDMTNISNKSFIILFVLLFGISKAILLIASTSQTPVPTWGGYLDVAIVFLIALTGFVIYQRNKGTSRYDISYQVATYFFPLILVGMWVYRDSLDFNILLPGAAWRTYFFLSILPHALNLWKPEPHR